MVTVLFWNLAKNPATLPHLRCLTEAHGVDLLLLAEAPPDLSGVVAELAQFGRFRAPIVPDAKVRVLTRLKGTEFRPRRTADGGDMTTWSLQAPALDPPEVLVAVVHLPSKAGGTTADGQSSVAREVAAEVAEQEDRRRHRQSVVVGDFNMDPFDPGMTLVTGVHGLMTRPLARLPDRVHRGRDYRRLYNPMWGLFGDSTDGPAGTYYWRSSAIENRHWSMFDQVLVRPALIDRLQGVTILGRDGHHDLTGPDGAPDRRHLSDHLPVLFRLDV